MINVDLVAVDVAGHGNVMSVVILKSIGIVHGQNRLILVGDRDRARAGCDALFRACLRARIGSPSTTLGVANPTVHGLGIARK